MSNRKGMSCQDAGRLGAAASAEYQHERLRKNIEEYNKNPKLCKKCGNQIPYEKRLNDFCSHECAARFNNSSRAPLTIQERYDRSIKLGGDGHKYVCVNCGKLRRCVDDPFCSDECREAYEAKTKSSGVSNVSKHVAGINAGKTRWEIVKQEIAKTGEFPACSTTNETRRTVVRKFLEEKNGHVCEICGGREWNGKPIPLVVDHKDGVSTNHKVDNFRLVCPNCDATSETFKNKHARKSSRTWRKKYYTPHPKT